MALEFNKIIDKVERMGRWLARRDPNMDDRLDEALALYEASTDLENIQKRIRIVRQSSVSGYRGAAPLDSAYAEILPERFARPALPPLVTILACDGSQIYPDRHTYPRYYLLNIGLFVYYTGVNRRPDQFTLPQLYYTGKALRDTRKRLINRRTVDARRSVREVDVLSQHAWQLRHEAGALVTFVDNRLLFFTGGDVTGADKIMNEYRRALVRLHRSNAILGGYVDAPQDSRQVIRLLHLLSMEEERIYHSDMRGLGKFDALTDIHLFRAVLRPGERSALLVQNSPANYEYRESFGEDYEIAFFFVNVSRDARPHIARVDLPMWVARDKAAVDTLHAAVVSQCAIQGSKPYPYALTRADELAYVSGKDREKLEELIHLEMRKHLMTPGMTPKQSMKNIARGFKRRHKL
ncbi:MAG: DNA double-strand break repair nuclease NurA [Chloroflexi bacterium]|nr:DNA double-strand break repair nuclease NurA [Chloroflexota bacterium]